jgi:HAE1 family hydrophobic/amphiphilic exporter-1
MKISDISIRRPVFATMMILALLVLGWFSYEQLSVELFPEVDFPFVVVQTVYPGASAETIETEVTEKIEEAVNRISGIRHITSQSREGYTFTFIEFDLEIDGAVASQDVREKISQVRADLPEDIEEPIVSQFDPQSQAVMSISVSGRRTPREITQLVKDLIRPRLEAVSGVGSVELIGGSEREILVMLDPNRMESHQVSVGDIENAIMLSNMEIPGGRVDEASQEYLLRLKGRLQSVREFNDIIVRRHQGIPVYLSDVAVVRDTIAEQRSISTLNGRPAVALNVISQSGANVVDLADGVKATISELQAELPPDMAMEIVNDNSVFITDSIHEILFNIRFGTLLAVIVIFLFLLDIRPTIITGLSIPISIIATFTIMNFLGFTINFMTLLGLSLAVGILIDDSIVVVENIYRRMQTGEKPMVAAFLGAKEIGLAVAATTFSIMVVFLPVAFMEGIVGRFFYQFGITVAFAVLISLFVAFSLVPMLAARTGLPSEDPKDLDPARAKGWRKLWLQVRRPLSVWNRAFDSLNPRYRRMLAYALRHRLLVGIIATIAFVAAIAAVPLLGVEFMTQTDQGKMYVSFDTPPGTDLEETHRRAKEIEKAISRRNEVQNMFLTIGGENTPVNEGTLLVLLSDAAERELSAQLLVDTVRKYVKAVPGVNTSVALEQAEGGSEKPVELSIRGENRDELRRLAYKVQDLLGTIPGATDVDNTLEEGSPELHIDVDRKLADDLGLSIGSISQTIRSLVEGDVITQYKEGDEQYDVRMRVAEEYRDSDEAIGRLLVASNKDVPGKETFLVPISRVAELEKTTAIGEYQRFDRQPEVRVNANVLSGYFAGTVTNQVMAVVDTAIQLSPGYVIAPVGTQEIMEESFTNIFRALILSVIFIYLLLASQYESFWDPLSIMLSLPLSLVGAVLGLLVFNSALSIMSLIGIVMLMGLVTKNAILLIDFVKQRREEGVERNEAILQAGPIRLRPILMTTFATVFGMLPLALGIGPGAELRAPMARAVIGGMLSSTLLTLVVVPVVYTIIDDVVGWIGRKIGVKLQSEGPLEIEIEKEQVVHDRTGSSQ